MDPSCSCFVENFLNNVSLLVCVVTIESVIELGWYFSLVIIIDDLQFLDKLELSSIPDDVRVIIFGVVTVGWFITLFAF